ncbi:MAG TPA: hypothetical protein PKA58_33755 [Polyangium sp.]|nr:hypothetical protein [Polyangium sp.]
MKWFGLVGLVLVGCQSASANEVSNIIAPCVCASTTLTDIQSADYKALHHEHVLVNFNAALPGDITVTLPASVPAARGAHIRVTDVSADGGIGNGAALRINATFSPIMGGHYATSGYVVAGVFTGVWNSKRGATIDLVDNGDGWLIVSEGHQPD